MATLNNIITQIRGDSYSFDLVIEDDAGEPYVIQTGDAVYFGVMEPNQLFEDAILRKSTTPIPGCKPTDIITHDGAGTYTITLAPSDTEYLQPGLYYYAVKLEINHEDELDANERVYQVKTVINNTKFILLN